MGTKKHNILVITVSVIISVAIWMITMKNHDPKRIESRTFKVANGWGYDILVNDSILIHQESIPVLQANQVFKNKEQAEQTAELVVRKLKKGLHPTLTKFDLDKILRPNEAGDNQQKNLE
jgi:hypothetical protein